MLIGELIVYPCFGVRHRSSSSVICRRSQFQTSSPKPLAILCGDFLGRGNKCFKRQYGHMTKIVATPIATKLDMQDRGLLPIIVFFSNNDPRLTLTYFSANQIL